MPRSNDLSPVKLLIVQWRALAKIVVALAREIALLEKFDPQRGALKAEMLEVWLRFALFNLVAQVAALHAEAEDPDDPNIHYLHKIAVCLSMLLVIVGHLKRKCLARSRFAGWALNGRAVGALATPGGLDIASAPIRRAIDFFDTS